MYEQTSQNGDEKKPTKIRPLHTLELFLESGPLYLLHNSGVLLPKGAFYYYQRPSKIYRIPWSNRHRNPMMVYIDPSNHQGPSSQSPQGTATYINLHATEKYKVNAFMVCPAKSIDINKDTTEYIHNRDLPILMRSSNVIFRVFRLIISLAGLRKEIIRVCRCVYFCCYPHIRFPGVAANKERKVVTRPDGLDKAKE